MRGRPERRRALNATNIQPNKSHEWRRYLLAVIVPFVLICVWRSSFAQSLRPGVGFDVSWRDLVVAWLPEGIAFGLSSFAAQRIFCARHRVRSRISVASLGYYLLLWLPVWIVGVIVPGGTVLNVFSSYLPPLKDAFLVGGPVGGIVAGSLVLAYATICFAVILIELSCAAAWAGFVQSPMTRSALQGSGAYQPEGSGGRMVQSAVLFGTLFWTQRLIGIAVIEDALWRGLIDAACTMLLIGAHARQIASSPGTPSQGLQLPSAMHEQTGAA